MTKQIEAPADIAKQARAIVEAAKRKNLKDLRKAAVMHLARAASTND